MPRLFTGLEIPASIRDDLALMRGGLMPARWIDPEYYHLTLRFIGDVEPGLAHEIDLALSGIRHAPFTLTLDALDCLGGAKPHSLVVRAQGSPALLDLQAAHERRLQRLGLPAEPRKFVPHVTLARFNGASARGVADMLAARGLFRHRKLEVTRSVLFSARALTGGGPYVVEAEYPLEHEAVRGYAMAGR